MQAKCAKLREILDDDDLSKLEALASERIEISEGALPDWTILEELQTIISTAYIERGR
jgi:uncharacterized protein with NRDE domain